MRILILGSEGFLGSYICKECNYLNLDFIPINRNSWNELLKINLKVWLIKKNITDIIFCCGYSKRFNCQDIEGIKEFETLNYLTKNTTCKIIYLSSTLVYGFVDPNLSMVDENTICKPTGAYGMYKRLMEKLVLENNNKNCVARLVSCIGKTKKSGLFENIEKQLMQNKNQIKMDHGNTTRDYIWVGFASKLILQLAVNKKANGIFNIGSGVGLKVSEIIEKLSFLYKKNINFENIRFGELMSEDPKKLIINVSKIKSILSKKEKLEIFESDQIKKYFEEFETL